MHTLKSLHVLQCCELYVLEDSYSELVKVSIYPPIKNKEIIQTHLQKLFLCMHMPLHVFTKGMTHTHTLSSGWEKELSRHKALRYRQCKVLNQGQSITLVICTFLQGDRTCMPGERNGGAGVDREWGGLASGSLPSASQNSSSLFICFLQCPCSQDIFWTKISQLRRNVETTGTIQFPNFIYEATEAQLPHG